VRPFKPDGSICTSDCIFLRLKDELSSPNFEKKGCCCETSRRAAGIRGECKQAFLEDSGHLMGDLDAEKDRESFRRHGVRGRTLVAVEKRKRA